MHGNITPEPKPEKPAAPAEKKYRTITLTNRAPLKIVEEEWPIIAKGECGTDDSYGCPWGWTMEMRVRRDKYGRVIIHAKYYCYDENVETFTDDNQMVRVGRYLSAHEAEKSLWQVILEVGEEMRSRIGIEKLKRHVVYVTDAVFASLDPQLN